MRKALVTTVPVTGIRLLPGVCAFVSFQITFLRKALVTTVPVTGIRLLPGVDAFVSPGFKISETFYNRPSHRHKMRLCFLDTDFLDLHTVPVTGIRLLPGMGEFVCF